MNHTHALEALATEILGERLLQKLYPSLQTAAWRASLIHLDAMLVGPSILVLTATGRYATQDRDVFRPLQYCATYLLQDDNTEWATREIVHMSGLHLESLVKRIGRLGRVPLGGALRKASMKRRLDDKTREQLTRFTRIYNAAKHDIPEEDRHLFSVADAVLAYLVARALGLRLYPLAHLKTDRRVFERA